MLNRIDVDRVVAGLPENDRILVLAWFEIELPPDWGGRPVTATELGAFLGKRESREPLSEATVRWRVDRAMRELRAGRDGPAYTKRVPRRRLRRLAAASKGYTR